MHFNPEINLGTCLELLVFAIAIGGGLMRIGRLEAKLNIMFDWFQDSIIGGNRKASDVRRFHGEK